MEQKESKSSKHFKISLIKSLTRVVGFAFLCNEMFIPAGFTLIAAEILGILEEL